MREDNGRKRKEAEEKQKNRNGCASAGRALRQASLVGRQGSQGSQIIWSWHSKSCRAAHAGQDIKILLHSWNNTLKQSLTASHGRISSAVQNPGVSVLIFMIQVLCSEIYGDLFWL
jgi:hypothetical protein